MRKYITKYNNQLYDNIDDMSTGITVQEAKRQLRQARLAEHKSHIRQALEKNDDVGLAKASSGFVALFRNKVKTPKKA